MNSPPQLRAILYDQLGLQPGKKTPKGELSTDDFADHWARTQGDLFGDAMEVTDGYRSWWSYIPHFIGTPGYVYAYAYGQLLALSVYRRYEEEGEGFVRIALVENEHRIRQAARSIRVGTAARTAHFRPEVNDFSGFNGLQAVDGQLNGDWELIVIDDGSTDSTADIVREVRDERIHFQQDGRRLGLGARLDRLERRVSVSGPVQSAPPPVNEAVAAPEFNLQGIQATTNPVAVWVIATGFAIYSIAINLSFLGLTAVEDRHLRDQRENFVRLALEIVSVAPVRVHPEGGDDIAVELSAP